MENITRIRDGLMKSYYNMNPVDASQDRAILAGEYAWIMGQLETILSRKPAIWNEMRKSVKSDTACERMWEQTSDGLNEAGLRLRSKGIEKMMTALGSLIKIAEGEAKNQF